MPYYCQVGTGSVGCEQLLCPKVAPGSTTNLHTCLRSLELLSILLRGRAPADASTLRRSPLRMRETSSSSAHTGRVNSCVQRCERQPVPPVGCTGGGWGRSAAGWRFGGADKRVQYVRRRPLDAGINHPLLIQPPAPLHRARREDPGSARRPVDGGVRVVRSAILAGNGRSRKKSVMRVFGLRVLGHVAVCLVPDEPGNLVAVVEARTIVDPVRAVFYNVWCVRRIFYVRGELDADETLLETVQVRVAPLYRRRRVLHRIAVGVFVTDQRPVWNVVR